MVEQETRNSTRIEGVYDTALRNIYDELYELNVTDNSYKIIYHYDKKFVTPPDEGILSEVILRVAEEMISPEDKKRFLDFFDLERMWNEFKVRQSCFLLEVRKLWIDGKYHWSSLTVFPLINDRNEKIWLCFVMDISDKKRMDIIESKNRLLQKQKLDDERYRIIIKQTETIVCERMIKENKYYYSPELIEKLTGNYTTERDLVAIWKEDKVIHSDDIALFQQNIEKLKEKCGLIDMEIRLLNRDNIYRWYRVIFTTIFDEKGEAERMLGILNDIDQEKKAYEELRFQAEFDSLTGIFNIDTFYKNAKNLLDSEPKEHFCVIRLDINGFKFINDLYGMEEGNTLLKYIASVIAHNVTKKDTYGRMNSDIFCICMHYSVEEKLLDKIRKIIRAICHYSDQYQVRPSLGICIVHERDVPINILCDWAHLAQKTIKGSLIRQWAFYDKNLRAKQIEEQMIENEMDFALSDHQFKVYLQPKHNMKTGKVIGAEALVRWEHPEKGVMMPDRFIPLFERNGFIIKLDEFVWEETCKILKSWINCGYTLLPISMNVSRVHIFNPNFNDKLLKLVDQYQLPHGLIEVELTESSFVENAVDIYKSMERLQDEGISFSMDDFGAGYSSLNMLKNAPINTIKLDREFLNEAVATKKGKTVIQHTIHMVNDLGLNVIAEGVETEKQADFLASCGCMVAQGYYFSKPMPVKLFKTLYFSE
ncbi:MAG: EAL domain-containing protein [Eubacterium sp.]